MNHTRDLMCGVLMGACGIVSAAPPSAALPTGGQVIAGSGQIDQKGSELTVTQSSSRLIASWSTFDIGSDASVRFVQPSASSVALNRILDANPSEIFGHLTANGRVFLLNPNGILFGSSAQVNVGALVASSLYLSDEDFLSGHYAFINAGHAGPVENRGILEAGGGVVALIAPQVSNSGTITADRGSAVLAAGDTVNLDFQGDGLVTVNVDRGAFDALAENQGLIQADGGQVVMTAKGAGALLDTVVNNDGVIRAQTLEDRDGRILLLGGMDNDRILVGGTLDASAPNGGNGGFIETSAAEVAVNDPTITTLAPQGKTGNWLIDPNDYTIAAAGGDITGAALATALNSTDVTIETTTQGTAGGNGDIFVNDAVAKTSGSPTTLTLVAERNIEINQSVSSSAGRLNVVLTADADADSAGDVAFAATGSVSTLGGNFISGNLSGENVTIGGQAFTMAPGAYVDSGAGRLFISQNGDVTLAANSLRSTSGTYSTNAGNYTYTLNYIHVQTAGDILTANTDASTPDILAASDVYLSGANIGAAAAGEQIKISGPSGLGSAYSAFPNYARTLVVTNTSGNSHVNEMGNQIFGTINVAIGSQANKTQNIQIMGDANGTGAGHILMNTDGAGVLQLAAGDIRTAGVAGIYDPGTPGNSTDPSVFPTGVAISADNITMADHAVDMGSDTFYWAYPGAHYNFPNFTHANFSATAWGTLLSVSNNGVAEIDGIEVSLTAANLGTALNPVEVGSGSDLTLTNTGGSTYVKSVDDSFSAINLYNVKAAGTHSVLFSGGDHIDYSTDGNGIIVPTLGARSDGSSFATTTGIDGTGADRSVGLTALSGYIEYNTDSVELGAGASTSSLALNNSDRNAGRAIYASNANDGAAEITAGDLSFNVSYGAPGAIEDIEFAQGGSSNENSLSVNTSGGHVDLTELTANHIKSLYITLNEPNVAQNVDIDLLGSDDVSLSDDGSVIGLDATKVNLAANDRNWYLVAPSRAIQIDGISFGSGTYFVNTISTITLNADLLTDGGDIQLLSGSGIRLLQSVRIDSNADDPANSTSAGAAGNISLYGPISATGGNHALMIDSSSTTTSGGSITLLSNTNNDGGDYLSAFTLYAKGATDMSDGLISLAGSSYLLNGDFAVTGQTFLSGGNLTIDTEQGDTGSGGNIRFSGSSLYAYPYYSYTFDTSTAAAGMNGGDVELYGTYQHSTLNPRSLSVTSTGGAGGVAGNILLPAVTTDYYGSSSSQSYDGTITLHGDLRTNGGSISLNGDTRLAGSVTLDTWSGTSTPTSGSQQTRSAGSVTIGGVGVSATAADQDLTIDTSTDTGSGYYNPPTNTVDWNHSGGNVSVTAGNSGGSNLDDLNITTTHGGTHNTGTDGLISLKNVVTTGNQIYDGAVILGYSGGARNITTLTSLNGDVTFGDTVNAQATHQQELEVVAANGTVRFNGAVGDSVIPFGLYVTGDTVIEADMSFGRAEFFSPVTLGADLTLAQACCYGLHFHDTVDGAHALTVNTDGLSFDGAVGGHTALTSLTVTGPTFLGSNVTTSGLQSYNGDVSLRSSSTLTQTGAGSDFVLQPNRSILNVSGGDIDFAIETTGDVVLDVDSAISSSAGEMNVALHGGGLAMGAGSSISANGGDIEVRADAFSADATARLQSSGSLTVAPYTAGTTVGIAGGAGTLALSTANLATNFVDGFSGLTFGSASAGALTVGGAVAFDESLTLVSGDDIHLDAALNGTGQTLTLRGGNAGTVSGAGTITASNLLLLGNADYPLSSASGHHVGTLAAAGVSSVDFKNNGSLTIGTVGSTEGIAATGDVTLDARGANSDLTLVKPVGSVDGDIVLAAGRNFLNSNASGTGIDPGTGRYLVYSANPGATTEGMSGYAKHYNQTYTAGSAPDYADSGNWFLYSVAPVLSVAPADSTVTYGDTPSLASSFSGFIDGDTTASAGIDGEASYLIGGPTSSSGHTSAGVHEVSYSSGLASSLGYTFEDDANSTQELTVERKALNLAGLTAADKPFDGNTSATVTSFGTAQGVLDGDALVVNTGTAQATFADEHIGTAKTVTVTSFGLSGTDAGNYVLGDQEATADIINSGPDIPGTGHSAALNAVTTGLLTSSAGMNGTADTALNAAHSGSEKGSSVNTIRPGNGGQALADIEADQLVTDATVSVTPADCSATGNDQLTAGCREAVE